MYRDDSGMFVYMRKFECYMHIVRLLHAYITSGCVMKESGIWNERSRGSWPS